MKFLHVLCLVLAIFVCHVSVVNGVLQGYVNNHCTFPVWCKTADTAGGDSHEVYFLPPGETYKAFFPTIDGPPPPAGTGVGVTMKVESTADPGFISVYQIEYSSSGGSWYDMSAYDGEPFLDVQRTVTGPDPSCPVLTCAPGQFGSTCEYTFQDSCKFEDGDLNFTLC